MQPRSPPASVPCVGDNFLLVVLFLLLLFQIQVLAWGKWDRCYILDILYF